MTGNAFRIPGPRGRSPVLLAWSGAVFLAAAGLALAGLPANGLVLHYSFDADNGTTVPDESGGGNLGLITTNLEWTAFGISEGAYRFHGSNEYITAGPMFNWTNFSQGFTLSFWTRQIEAEFRGVYYAGTTGGSGAQTNRFDLGCNIISMGDITFRLFDDEGDAIIRQYPATGVDDGEWHHVALLVSSNANDIHLMLDGADLAVGAGSGTVFQLNGGLKFPFVIGTSSDGGGGPSHTNSPNGYLDDFRVYSRRLASNEAVTLFRMMEDEPNDTVPQARPIAPGQTKHHTFKALDDEDWEFFYTFTNYTNYVFSTKNTGTNVDTQLTIYRNLDDGTLGLVTSVNNTAMGSGLGESWTLNNFSNDLYYVKISAPTGLYGGGGGMGPARRAARSDGDAGFGEGSEYQSELVATATPGVRIVYVAAPDNGRQAGVWAKVDSTTLYFPARNEGLAFPGVSEALHLVEVGFKPGVRPWEHPTRPGQLDNPNSSFGNPHWVDLRGSSMFTICVFRCESLNYQQATVRDGYTGAHLSDAAVTCISDSAPFTGTETRRGHAYETSYQQLWRTLADGSFPTNLMLYPTTWDIRLNRDGYVTRTITDAVAAVGWGYTNNLGDLRLYPVDANFNGIADAWELAHFPIEAFPIDPAGDLDEDGLSNWAEYMADTDPTNDADRLDLSLTAENDTLRLRWQGRPWRRYRIGMQAVVAEEGWDSATDTVTHSGTSGWEQVWSDVNWLDNSQRVYRLEVLPP